MSSGEIGFLSRKELLEGMPAKRAQAVLFAMENLTARLVAQSRQAVDRFLTQRVVEERDLALLGALALGRDLPIRPVIQELEYYAPQWAFLVPDNPPVRAAVIHMLGQKYRFTHQVVPNIRAALGSEDGAVQEAYERLYHRSLGTVFAKRSTPIEWIRWRWAQLTRRIDSLSPFWMAFAMTLTETVGAGYLALPIALATIGPLAGVLVLIVLGLVNVLSIGFIAEAVTRSGTIRYGSAFVGRAVNDYLGRPGAIVLTISLFAYCWLVLTAYYIGFSRTLENATHVPAELWIAALFVVGAYFVRKKTLNVTAASALLVGVINISLLLILSLISLAHAKTAYLLYVNVPLLNERPFEPSILHLIFGVVLSAYFGHLSVSNCAQVVLRREPEGRSLIWGAMAAQIFVVIIYCVWVVAVNGSIEPDALSREHGTALTPLATEFGPIVYVVGSVIVVLGIGMASITPSLGLFNLTREWLPARYQAILRLLRRQGKLLLRSTRGGGDEASEPRLGLTYLGLVNDSPEFRLDIQDGHAVHFIKITTSTAWDAATLLHRFPSLHRHGLRFTFEVQEATAETVLIRVSSSFALAYRGERDTAGLTAADIFALPADQRRLINWLTRHRAREQQTVTVPEVAAHLGISEKDAVSTLNELMTQGFIQALDKKDDARRTVETQYQLSFAPKRSRKLSDEFWKSFDEKRQDQTESRIESGFAGRSRFLQMVNRLMLSKHARSVVPFLPVGLVFLLTEWLVLTGQGSFTAVIGFLGVIVVSLLGGCYPVLMLVAGQRKGEYSPNTTLRFLSHPIVAVGVYVLYLLMVLTYGLVIWQDSLQRAFALGVVIMTLGMTAVTIRRGLLTPRITVELREDRREDGRAAFSITAAGEPASADVLLRYPHMERNVQASAGDIEALSTLHCAEFGLPPTRARELKAWAHRITSEGDSEGLPVLLNVYLGDEKMEFDLTLSDGQVLLPLNGKRCRLSFTPVQE